MNTTDLLIESFTNHDCEMKKRFGSDLYLTIECTRHFWHQVLAESAPDLRATGSINAHPNKLFNSPVELFDRLPNNADFRFVHRAGPGYQVKYSPRLEIVDRPKRSR